MFKSGELKLLWPFYLDALISPMLFFMPAFLVVYFINIGVSLFQVSLLTATMSLAMIIFEIPTGAVADIYGRKFSVLFGALIQGIAMFSIFFIHNYYFLFVSFALVGIGVTFNSGAREAWITDLIHSRDKKLLPSFFSKYASIDSFAMIFSGILGAYIVKHFGLSFIWLFTGASFFITFAILFFAPEYFVRKPVNLDESYRRLKNQSLTSLSYVRKHFVLFWFLIASAFIVFGGLFGGDLAWITLLTEYGFPESYFGYMWSVFGVIGVIAPFISFRYSKKKPLKLMAYIILFLVLANLLIIFAYNYIFILAVLLLTHLFFMMHRPVERTYIHSLIKSKSRATVVSIESMFLSLIGVLVLPLVGLSVDFIGARNTILLSVLFTIPAVFIYLILGRNKKL
ncbi:MAG: Major facilitator superfamily [Parcubacteria group bacterium GW2011_GWA1_36_12]|nr:MAG: Major facilitator superfamily [Parcubacteria group bacterium GW2011_GWA1_36_12]